jgi:hypothetical protein
MFLANSAWHCSQGVIIIKLLKFLGERTMQEKYSLNEQTLRFIIEFEKKVEPGKTYTIQELVDLFKVSPHYNEKFNFYKKPPNNSMWYAVTRSGNWLRVKNGIFKKK